MSGIVQAQRKAAAEEGAGTAAAVGAESSSGPGLTFSMSSELVTIAAPQGARAEAVRTLRTYIMAQHIEDGRRGLAVCGASAGVGCTFTAVNLAVALAQIGVKTLLVDGNLRQPGVEAFVRPSRSVKGLRQLLTEGNVDPTECIQSEVLPALAVMYAGGVADNAQELLASDECKNLIDRCLRDFDLTIIDTPPANGSADVRRISTLAGYSLIVARRNLSFVSDVTVLAAQLTEDRAHVIGTVMNEA